MHFGKLGALQGDLREAAQAACSVAQWYLKSTQANREGTTINLKLTFNEGPIVLSPVSPIGCEGTGHLAQPTSHRTLRRTRRAQ